MNKFHYYVQLPFFQGLPVMLTLDHEILTKAGLKQFQEVVAEKLTQKTGQILKPEEKAAIVPGWHRQLTEAEAEDHVK